MKLVFTIVMVISKYVSAFSYSRKCQVTNVISQLFYMQNKEAGTWNVWHPCKKYRVGEEMAYKLWLVSDNRFHPKFQYVWLFGWFVVVKVIFLIFTIPLI